MNTVLNISPTNKAKILSQPMFLGETLGLQRYDVVKYPVFKELYLKQQEFMWRPNEINLQEDRNSYEELSDVERFVFDSNLKFQTMGDSMFARSAEEIKKYVSNTELEYAIAVWSFMENVHSESYTHVLQSIQKDPHIFFDSILEDKEIVHRANEMRLNFDKLLNTGGTNLKEDIFKSVLSFQIAEGIIFYTSFACSFWFGSRGKMTGNSDIIKLISRDENLHASITQNIIKNWKNDPSEGFSEVISNDLIYDTFGLAVDGEKRWAEYLFSKGPLVGLTPQVLGAYSEWLANARLRSMGFEKIFDQPNNPIGGWLNEFVDSSKTQTAPQEREITLYKKSAIKSDIGGGVFNFKL